MDWFAAINAYCERSGPGFWDEPFNAWTNLGFWVAAAISAVAIRRATVSSTGHSPAIVAGLWVLVGWLIAIGIGSFCFHTFAMVWAGLLDIGTIIGWIGTFLWLQMRYVLRWGPGTSGIVMIAFFGMAPLVMMICPLWVCTYLPTLGAAALLGVWAVWRRQPGGKLLVATAVVFALSMTVAALDHPLCDLIPIGTHWLWHLLNATALTLAMLALIRQSKHGSPA